MSTDIDKIIQARRLLRNLREKIMSCAAHAVENFKTAGVSALDKAVSAMHVKPMPESLQQKISDMIAGTKENMAKVAETGHRLRSAGVFLKDAGRALTGRETYWVDGGQEGHIQAAILAPLRALSGMNRATLAALRGVEHLGRAEETREEKQSGRRLLLENRPKVLALPAPAQEKRKTPEVLQPPLPLRTPARRSGLFQGNVQHNRGVPCGYLCRKSENVVLRRSDFLCGSE